jgi:hypothetical protein
VNGLQVIRERTEQRLRFGALAATKPSTASVRVTAGPLSPLGPGYPVKQLERYRLPGELNMFPD